jgi:hypothetical protein
MTDYEIEESVEESTSTRWSRLKGILQKVIIHAAVVTYLTFAILQYINSSKVLSIQPLSN